MPSGAKAPIAGRLYVQAEACTLPTVQGVLNAPIFGVDLLGLRGRRIRFGFFFWRILLFAFAIAVNGVLLRRTLELYFDRNVVFVDFVVFAVGLEAGGDDLNAHVRAQFEQVQRDFAFVVGLEFHVSVIFAASERMEDDGCVFNRFPAGGAEDGDLKMRRGGRCFVFAAAFGRVVLSMGESGDGEQNGRKESEAA